jgi:hypothetical protein
MTKDSFVIVRRAGIACTTGLTMAATDTELREGTWESRWLHAHRKKYHQDEHLAPIVYLAGKPLKTDAEIRRWRSKQTGSYRLDNWLFSSFTHAYNYATGKPAKTKQGYLIQQGKPPRRI